MLRFVWLTLLAFISLVSTITHAKVSITESEQETTYNIEIEGVSMKPVSLDGREYLQVELRGVNGLGAIRYSEGRPEIPVVRLIVEGDVSVETGSATQTGMLKSGLQIKPSQSSWSKSAENRPSFTMDLAAYQANGFEMMPAYEVESVGSYRGKQRHMVTLNAVDYNPGHGLYRLTTNYKIIVKKENKRVPLQPTFAMVVGAKFAESPALEKLVRIKQTQGFRVREFVVGTDVAESPEAIRGVLRSLFMTGENLEFALLIGDVDDVPAQKSEYIYGVTDHYYRSIDSDDYQSDINSPDIGVGRLSVSNENDLGIIVDKIDRYMSGKFLSERASQTDAWLRHPAFIATHDRYQVAEATHNKVIKDFFAPRGYSRAFPDQTEKGGDKLYPVTLSATKRQILDNIAQGRFIINFSGHGSHTGWEDVSANDVLAFSHPSALPWVLSNSCITGDFREEPVFAETWLRHPSGAINFWGSMDSTYWDEDDILEKALYREVFDRGVRAFDRIYQGALSEVWRYYGGANRSRYYWETYVTFGDPSLGLRMDHPRSAEIKGPVTLIKGQPKARWQVLTSGAPARGAHVALVRESDGMVVSAQVDAGGVAEVDLRLLGPLEERLKFYVHGADLLMSERYLQITESFKD